MHSREDVELALMALEEGWTRAAAGALVGASGPTVSRWAAGRVPHERRGAARGRGRMAPGKVREEAPVNESERAAYEAAMTENMLLRAVLADLKAGGSDLRSISNRRKTELGERLRAATGLPLREITAFLRISRSSYEYHRARLGRDRDADIRASVVGEFGASDERYGYRRVWAALRARGVRASEKRVRRVMREEGLEARPPPAPAVQLLRRRGGARLRAEPAARGRLPRPARLLARRRGRRSSPTSPSSGCRATRARST